MLIKRLAVPHEVEKGVVLPPRFRTLDAECTCGTTTRRNPCGWPRRSSSVEVAASDDKIVAEDDVDDAADGSVEVQEACVNFDVMAGGGESCTVSLWRSWTAASGEAGYNAGLDTFRLLGGICDEDKRVGGARDSVPPSSEQAFSQFGHRPSAFGPCSQSARCSVQNILPQHSVRQGTTAYSKHIPQSRSTASFFRRVNEEDDDGVCRTGTLGIAMRAAAHFSTKALFSKRFGVLAVGDSVPRSK